MNETPDPFRAAREAAPTLPLDVDGEQIPLLLRMQDIRKACKNTADFSNANPFHITLRPETGMRNFRQFPIETDPPEHTAYRAIVEPLFRRAEQPEYCAAMERILQAKLQELLRAGEAEIVRDFALPVQCLALTHLLGLPTSEAALWMEWGTHIFHDGQDGGAKVEAYIAAQLARAEQAPASDFFSVLNQSLYDGRPLTYAEKQGFANLAFAGGRDTIIQTLTGIFAAFAQNPGLGGALRAKPEIAVTATEEIVRLVTPLTAISRTCTRDTEHLAAGGRVGLCWASANREDRFFPNPDTFDAERSPNPHVGFGFGPHNCLGASHARSLLRSLFHQVASLNIHVEILEAIPHLEQLDGIQRSVGYDLLRVRLSV
jgi:cytochrome P450